MYHEKDCKYLLAFDISLSIFTRNAIMKFLFPICCILLLVLFQTGYTQNNGKINSDSIKLHVTTTENVTRHSVLFAVNELMNFAIAARNTYLSKRKEAVGVHLSIYGCWVMQGSVSKENDNDFKLSAYYQYYLVNNLRRIYLKPELSIGNKF